MTWGNLGSACGDCGLWIQPTGDWGCEECGEHTCPKCGRVDDLTDLFLCFECFNQEGTDSEQ